MKVRLLGPIQVADGAGWTSIRAPQQRALLAVLTLEEGRIVTVDKLVDELWGDRPPASAPNTIHAYVMRLRRALGDDLGPRLVTRSPGYQLQIDAQDRDTGVFERLVAEGQGEVTGGRWETASGRLAEALGLWYGTALDDVPSTPAVTAERSRLEQCRLGALEARIDADLELGRHSEVVAELEQLLVQHPLREHVRRQLMLALYRCGRRAEALEVYREGRSLFAEELGIEPAQELRDLERAILRDERPPPGTPEPPSRPASAAGRETVRPASTGAPFMLPPDIADFTGRADQIRQLLSMLTRGGEPTARPITAICGHGGIGKTALAVHVAHRLREQFPDGHLYVDLHGTEQEASDPGQVLARFLLALGVDHRALPAGVEERAERFRALLAHRRSLIVLDNAASERQIRPLLPGSPTSAVLVTSRRRVRWMSARTMDLDVLEPAAARALLARVVGAERVSREPAAAETIIRHCDHMPLALRIAGGRLAARAHWTLARMAARLTDERQRLDELAEDDMAVRASLELSYAALEPASQFMFRSLGLLDVPDFAVWVPAAMLGITVEEAETHLDSLIDAQLLGWTGADALRLNRYRLHDLVRLYARERAEQEDTTHVRAAAKAGAFGAWLAMAETADRLIPERVAADIRGSQPRRPTDPAVARIIEADPIAWFDSERASLTTVIAQAGAAGLDELAWELAAAAVNYFTFRGLYDDWRQTHELAARICDRAGNRRGEAVMLRNLGCLRMTGVEAPSRIVMLGAETALEAFRQADDLRGQIDTLFLRGYALRHKGEFDRAISDVEEGMAAARAMDYKLGQGRFWYLRAVIEREQGRETAAAYAELSFRLAEHNGTIHDRVLALWELAAAQTGPASAQRTWDRLQAHAELCRARGERLLEAYILLALGDLARGLQRGGARDAIERALRTFEAYAVPFGRGVALRLLGELDHAQRRFGAALTNLMAAADLSEQTGGTFEQALSLKALGAAHHASGDDDAARRVCVQSLTLFRRLGNVRETEAVTALLTSLNRVR